MLNLDSKRINLKNFALLASLLGTVPAIASSDAILKKWSSLNKDYSISVDDQAFCYRDQGVLHGKNEYKKVTIASVSKLITSLWAVESLGPDYQYPTKFFLKGKKLHIEGSLDPVFSSRKLFFLLAQLNSLGIDELEEITFDENLRIYTKAERYIGEILNITPARTAANLKDFWNTPGWQKLIPAYQEFVRTTPQSIRDSLQIPENYTDLQLKVGSVRAVNEMPFKGDGYLHLSPAIERYLKFTNIQSNNYIADQTFAKLGGEAGFDKYFSEIAEELDKDHKENRVGYKDEEPTVKMFSGSGLDSKRGGARVDNYANCSMVTSMIERMDHILNENQLHLSKVVAVPGTDGGTFRKRLKSPRLNKTFVAKTGTLYHTSALAGMFYGKKGKVSFGVFHQLTGWKGNAKMVQNHMVDALYSELEPAAKFDYQPRYFFPAVQTLEAITE